MVGELVEARPGRSLWLERRTGSPDGAHASSEVLALLVHGGCAHARQWEAQISFLTQQGISTLAYDALGCGQSAKPQSWSAYHPSELYADLRAIFQAESQNRGKVLLVAHSFGTALAVKLASEEGSKVAALVLVGAYVPGAAARPRLFSLARWLFYLPHWVLKVLQPGLTEGFLRAAFAPKTWEADPGLVERERAHSNANPPYMFKAFHRQLAQVATAEEFAGWAGRVGQPVAVVFGDADGVTPLYPGSTRLTKLLAKPPELVVVQDAGHQAMQEQPGEVNAAILAVLQKIV